jgi:hypothetical protein
MGRPSTKYWRSQEEHYAVRARKQFELSGGPLNRVGPNPFRRFFVGAGCAKVRNDSPYLRRPLGVFTQNGRE